MLRTALVAGLGLTSAFIGLFSFISTFIYGEMK